MPLDGLGPAAPDELVRRFNERNEFVRTLDRPTLQTPAKPTVKNPPPPALTPEQLVFYIRGMADLGLRSLQDPSATLATIFNAAQRAVVSPP